MINLYNKTRIVFPKPDLWKGVKIIRTPNKYMYATPYIATMNRRVLISIVCVSTELQNRLKSEDYYSVDAYLLNAANYLGSAFIFSNIRDTISKEERGFVTFGSFESLLLDYISAIEIGTIYKTKPMFVRTETRIMRNLIEIANKKGSDYRNIYQGIYIYSFDRSQSPSQARMSLCNALKLDELIIKKLERAKNMNDIRSILQHVVNLY